MDKEDLLFDFVIAVGIGVMLFASMVLLDDAPANIQYDPPCNGLDLTIIEELRCADE